MNIVWHYTYSHHFEEILASGRLLPPAHVASLDEGLHEEWTPLEFRASYRASQSASKITVP